MKIAVIGGGSWGTALANMLAKKGLETSLWVREPELFAQIIKTGENTWFLPEIKLDPSLVVDSNWEAVMKGADYFLFAVPSQYFKAVLQQTKTILPDKPKVICASKGLALPSLKTMSEIMAEELDKLNPTCAIFSGPSFAREVAREMPTAVTLACTSKIEAKAMQKVLGTDYLRVYTNTDVRGVELGGAVKNVIAIAVGITTGLGYGYNTRAALITRGLSEMSRLGKAMGGKEKTFMGLSGLGDLVLTSTGDLSRNRKVGILLGQGRKLLDILGEMKAVAEGVKTTEALYLLRDQLKVELPITDQVYQVLYQDKDPHQAVRDLMSRDLKEEHPDR